MRLSPGLTDVLVPRPTTGLATDLVSFRSCSFDVRPLGPGRNTMGRCHLHQAQPSAPLVQKHFHTSDRCIWRVASVCEVTTCRRPDQIFHFETPFIPLVQHAWQDRWPNSNSRTWEVWRVVMVDIGAIWRYGCIEMVETGLDLHYYTWKVMVWWETWISKV